VPRVCFIKERRHPQFNFSIKTCNETRRLQRLNIIA
jgi:hypothetical protein